MKPQRLFVILICLALGLMTAIAYVHRPNPIPKPAPTGVDTASPGGVSQAAPETTPAETAVEPPFSWRQIESEDYRQYMANLRSMGCPEQTIRDIVVADVNKLYAARESPLKTAPKPAPDQPAGETPEQKLDRLRQLRAIQLEKRGVIKELLGISIPLDLLPSSGSRDYHAFEVAFQYLPEDKRDTIQSLQEGYWQQSDALKAKYGNTRTPEFVAEYRQLSSALRQELAKTLTPRELEDYDLRTSSTAKELSTGLATYFHPTEEEFRQLFRAKRAYEEALQQLPLPSAPVNPAESLVDKKAIAQQRAAERQALEQTRSSALQAMNDQIKTALGENRYADYQRSQDRNYDLLARLGERYSLPQDTILQAYELQKSYKTRLGQGGSPADRSELQRQLNDQLTSLLGEQAARGYRRVHGGTVPIN